MADARKRRFDAVLCWKLDRWGRSVADSVMSPVSVFLAFTSIRPTGFNSRA
jgi:hypothetical protein